jgi:hypothetical protein
MLEAHNRAMKIGSFHQVDMVDDSTGAIRRLKEVSE